MNLQRAAEVQVVLEGVPLPATRDELVRYAGRQDAKAATELQRISDRAYDAIDQVGEELCPTQPMRAAGRKLPKAETGRPPGGDDYVRAHPQSGNVEPDAPSGNPPQKATEKAQKTVKKQQAG